MKRVLVAGLIGLCGMAGAQTLPPQSVPTQSLPTSAPTVKSAILTLDQDALFSQSLFGKTLRAQIDAEAAKVEAETRKIDADLEVEERDLTTKRPNLSSEEFRKLADAFDGKVTGLRNQREAAATALQQKEASARQDFIVTVTAIIGDYMVERGAVAIVDKKAIVVSLSAIDITADVIARIDAKLGAGSMTP